MNDDTTENQYCCDCGSKLQASSLSHSSNESCFEQIFVSINHGIFLCHNCASIHQNNYGVEISFVKRLIDNRTIAESQNSIYASYDQSTNSQGNKVLKLSKWTYTQLRVLIISGGNRAFRDYMD